VCYETVHIYSHRVGRVLGFFPVVGIGTPPTPHPQASAPSPLRFGGMGTLAGERGGGRVPIPTRGQTLWYSVYICTLCLFSSLINFFEKVTNKRCWQPPPPSPPPSRCPIDIFSTLHVEFSLLISFCFHCVVTVAALFSISNWIRFQKKFLRSFYLAEVQVLVTRFFSSISMFKIDKARLK
jgi:hypothetical protein